MRRSKWRHPSANKIICKENNHGYKWNKKFKNRRNITKYREIINLQRKAFNMYNASVEMNVIKERKEKWRENVFRSSLYGSVCEYFENSIVAIYKCNEEANDIRHREIMKILKHEEISKPIVYKEISKTKRREKKIELAWLNREYYKMAEAIILSQ